MKSLPGMWFNRPSSQSEPEQNTPTPQPDPEDLNALLRLRLTALEGHLTALIGRTISIRNSLDSIKELIQPVNDKDS